MLSSLSTDDAVEELRRVVSLGYQAVMVQCTTPEGHGYNDEIWDPLWAAAEEAGVVVSFHVGTGASPKAVRGPGAVVSNYVETFVPGRARSVTPRGIGRARTTPGPARAHRRGRASSVPALADRMDEGWRQHDHSPTPKLTKLPTKTIFEQVYASFQHDERRAGVAAMGYPNVIWSNDYPHMEGTYGHTQKTLHELFDEVAPETRFALAEGPSDACSPCPIE